MKVFSLWLFVCLIAVSNAADPIVDRERILSIPTPTELPFAIETVSQTEKEGIVLSSIFINGAPLGGKPTRIFAWYARPKSDGKYPAVIQLHGAGLKELSPDAAVSYAKAGYVCLSIDWCGAAKGREIPRTPPYSEFEADGGLAQKDDTGWHIGSMEANSIVNGVRFVRRGLDFLRSRPEVDSSKLCVSGMSAGAHVTLLVLGVEPQIRAAAVKYGSGYIRELNWGGYYGPISLSPRPDYERWLSVLDPKYGFGNIRASTLILSGTDDIFFWMPAVLATWRALPAQKALWMRPNDNHQWVNNEEAPRKWFNFILNGAAKWPEIGPIQMNAGEEGIALSTTASETVNKVTFWYKEMPMNQFTPRNVKAPGPKIIWQSVDAVKDGSVWKAVIPDSGASGKQYVIYANAENDDGALMSSDSIEIPKLTAWRLVSEGTLAH